MNIPKKDSILAVTIMTVIVLIFIGYLYTAEQNKLINQQLNGENNQGGPGRCHNITGAGQRRLQPVPYNAKHAKAPGKRCCSHGLPVV